MFFACSGHTAFNTPGTGGGGGSGNGFPTADGSVAAPAWTWSNDTALGWRRDPVSGMMGLVRENFEVLTFGNDTIGNLEPAPAVVRFAFRANVPAIDGVNESTVFYYRPTYSVGEQAQSFLYAEIDDDQVDTYGAAIKVVHNGHGDGIYVALFNDGVGLECATFADASRGILGSLQEPLVPKPNAVLIQGLWESETIPNYGVILADGISGNAFTARMLASAADGQSMYRLIDSAGLTRWAVYGDGAVGLLGKPATALAPLKESPEMRLTGKYWDGAASQDYGFILKTILTGAADGDLRIYDSIGALLAILRKSGGLGQLDMQLGSIVNAVISGYVPDARLVSAGTGLSGGGSLAADRTLSIAAGGVGATQLADGSILPVKYGAINPSNLELGGRITLPIEWAAGAAGARDVAVYTAAAPFKLRFVDALCITTAIGAGSGTAQLRTATGGGGSAISSTMATAATTNLTRNTAGGGSVAAQTIAQGGTVVLRLTDGSCAGIVYADFIRVT